METPGGRQLHFEDEVLESIWEMRELDGKVLYDHLKKTMEDVEPMGHKSNTERMDIMEDKGLYSVEGSEVRLSEQGESRARDIIRRHRLAERLFADVLDLQNFEADACRLEHALSHESEQAICTLLGHPPRCPHGKEIPKGACCAVFTRKVSPLTQRLSDIEVGKHARVLFIQGASVDRLGTMGLVPGTTVRLNQKKPAFVIEIDETTVAIDLDIAEGIYVKLA
jgi:DtxR family Mn-dependent transcriptional regulator